MQPANANANPQIDEFPTTSIDKERTEDGDSRRSDAACICMAVSAVLFVISLLTALGAAVALALHVPWGSEEN